MPNAFSHQGPWKVSPGLLTQARFLGDALALPSLLENSWGKREPAANGPGAGPGDGELEWGVLLERGALAHLPARRGGGWRGVRGCAERGRRRGDSSRAGKPWRRDSALHPATGILTLPPARERDHVPAVLAGGRGGGREDLLPAAAPDVQRAGHRAPPASSAPRLTSGWRRASPFPRRSSRTALFSPD